MKKINLLLFSVLFIFTGCVSGDVRPSLKHSQIKPYEKAFDSEDTYIVYAVTAEEMKDYVSAIKLYNTLWEKSKKKEYLYHELENMILAKEYKNAINMVDSVSNGSYDDSILIRTKIIALIRIGKFDKAVEVTKKLLEKTKSINDTILLSSIYLKEQQYNKALDSLNSIYIKNYDDKILDKMAVILYVNLDKKEEAIKKLETYIRTNGCSKIICRRLISFYANENNIDSMLSTYLRLYQIDKDKKVAKRIVRIYAYKKDYINMMDFLQSSHSDDELLLEIYVNMKNYSKAYPLAYKLYKKTADINYLGESGIYEYEANSASNNKKILNNVVIKLTKVVKQEHSPIYLNYLGYILIDKNIDVKKGITYVKKALSIEPNSAYYLDSLAWGYYKLGKCQKADKIMKKVSSLEGGDNIEVIKHIKIIKKCKKGKK